MENKKEKKDRIKEHIKKIVKPIFDKVLQETSSNPMMVGTVRSEKPIKFLWQPHNYRLYFDFEKSNFHPEVISSLYKDHSHKKEKVGLVGLTYSLRNHDSEHCFNNFYGCRITIKKNQVEVINKWHEKQWRLITASSIKEIDTRINEVVEKLDNQCLTALKKLMDIIGGSSNFKVLHQRGEHGIHGEDYLDKIPEKMIIHDTIFKKVYKRKVEFYNPTAVKNFISNRAIENISPEIANELAITKGMVKEILKVNASTSQVFNDFAKSTVPILSDFSSNIKTHNKVLKGINKSFKKFNTLLSQKKLKDFG